MPSSDKEETKILLVDDHPLVREWLANLINQQPDLMVSGEAENSQGAMRAVRDCPPHVAIVDISLGDSSGLELIKEIKQAYPEIRVLVLTMHEESHYAARALRAGAAAYLVKREATGKVIPALRAVLAGKLVLSQLPVETQPEANSTRAPDGVCSPMEVLTDREFEVFELLGKGLGTRQIAAALRLSIKTVQTHCSAVKEKLHLGTGRELMREAVRWYECRQPQ